MMGLHVIKIRQPKGLVMGFSGLTKTSEEPMDCIYVPLKLTGFEKL
jgi:hypothetical protein